MVIPLWEDDEKTEVSKFLNSLPRRDKIFFEPNTIVQFKSYWPPGSYEYEKEFRGFNYEKRQLEEQYDEAVRQDEQNRLNKVKKREKQWFKEEREEREWEEERRRKEEDDFFNRPYKF